jgi:hypothetical protein
MSLQNDVMEPIRSGLQFTRPVLRLIRHIAFGENSRRPSRTVRVLRHFARVVACVVMMTYLLDAINVDVIYAAVSGDMHYHDNPEILDSQFDSGCVATATVLGVAVQPTGHSSTTVQAPVKFTGTIVYEDVDSPTVLDGESQHDLVYEIAVYVSAPEPDPASVTPSMDRTISFLRILI